MTNEISNSADIIDSRDILERIEDLETDVDSLDDDEKEELRILKEIASECDDFAPDFKYGEALIRDSYFEEYAQQLAEDIGAIDPDAAWPTYHIDWEAAANSLQMDYACIDFDGVDYWIRS